MTEDLKKMIELKLVEQCDKGKDEELENLQHWASEHFKELQNALMVPEQEALRQYEWFMNEVKRKAVNIAFESGYKLGRAFAVEELNKKQIDKKQSF